VALQIDSLLQGMVKFGASDLHVKVGSPPGYRIDGQIQPVKNLERLTSQDTLELAKQLLSHKQFDELEERGDLDWAHGVPGLARFRVSAMKQRGSVSLFFRRIPVEPPDLDALDAPPVCKELAMRSRGLVLLAGPAACGKSTLAAAMVAHRNANARGHILTVEDPVEFIHPDALGFVNQREVGSDTPSFAAALRHAFRQDPDVIFVGELRDVETIALALTAAETEHLVLATIQMPGAAQTVERVIELFPADQQQQVRVQLSETLLGVIAQVLVPRVGGGLAAAREILLGTDGVRACIRDGNTSQLRAIMQSGGPEGMLLLETALGDLARQRVVELEDAWSKAYEREALERATGRAPSGLIR
jgi:twitching motility protein PilT